MAARGVGFTYDCIRTIAKHKTEDGKGLILGHGFKAHCNVNFAFGTIRVRDGPVHTITIERTLSGRMELGSSWQDVVSHYRIGEEDRLILKYPGGYHFDLIVIGPNKSRRAYYSTEACDCYTPPALNQVAPVTAVTASGAQTENMTDLQAVEHPAAVPDQNTDSVVAPQQPCGTFYMVNARLTRSNISMRIRLRDHPFLQVFGVRTWELYCRGGWCEATLEMEHGMAYFKSGWEQFVTQNRLAIGDTLQFRVFNSHRAYMVVTMQSNLA